MDRGIDGRTEAAAEEEKRAIQEKSCVKIQTDALPKSPVFCIIVSFMLDFRKFAESKDSRMNPKNSARLSTWDKRLP